MTVHVCMDWHRRCRAPALRPRAKDWTIADCHVHSLPHCQDELKKQGIHDDEEQRLLVANRVKPLAVETASAAPGGGGGGGSRWTPKQKLWLVAGLTALFVGLLVLVVAVRQPNPALARFTGAGAQSAGC